MKIFKDFCSSIWNNRNKRRIYNKTIRYKVRNDLLKFEIGQVFNTWSDVEYVTYKATTKDTDWCSLIRQKINNLYTRYFDEKVVLNKDYMDLLKTPRRLYYRWINNEEMNVSELTKIIDDAIFEAANLKRIYAKQKMQLSWNEYKKIIEKYLKNIFDNCKLIEDYEIEHLTNEKINKTNKYIYDFYTEDKFYVKYICNSLEGYILNYQKEYYGLSRGRNKQYIRCKECGALIEKTNNRVMYCKDCSKKINVQKQKIRDKKKKQNLDLEKSCKCR